MKSSIGILVALTTITHLLLLENANGMKLDTRNQKRQDTISSAASQEQKGKYRGFLSNDIYAKGFSDIFGNLMNFGKFTGSHLGDAAITVGAGAEQLTNTGLQAAGGESTDSLKHFVSNSGDIGKNFVHGSQNIGGDSADALKGLVQGVI